MQKTFFVGLLAPLALSGGYDNFNYDFFIPYQKGGEPVVQEKVVKEKPVTEAPYDFSAITSKTYPKVDVNSIWPSGISTSSVEAATSAVFNNARSNFSRINRSIDSLFLRLPSGSELDQLILNSDSVGLLRTIQVVATDDSLPCDTKMAYLLEVMGRIRSAVQMKQFALDQLKVIIDGANTEIKRLEDEIKGLEDNIKNLWLDELRNQLKDAVMNLEDLYRKFNAVEAEIAPNQAKIRGLEQEITTLTNFNDGERNRIANDKLKLTETEARIRDIENQLAAARSRKGALEASIKNAQGVIASNDAKIKDAQAKIDALEKEIKILRDEVDRLRAKYNDIEVQVERLRTDIEVAESKADRYRDQIRGFQDRINAEKKKLVPNEVDELLEMIESLKKLIPSVKSEIDRHYYYCYGEGSVKVEQNGGVVVYIVKGERFGDYLRNQYGQVAGPSLRGDVELFTVDIFSPSWSSRFGYPFPGNSLGGQGFDIAGSFSCLNPSQAQRGSGKIAAIGADYIDVDLQGGVKSRFNLGSCSRLEATSQLPTIGQNIAYVGVPSGADGYNLYQASCW